MLLRKIILSFFLSVLIRAEEHSDLYFGIHGIYNSSNFFNIKHHRNDIYGSGLISEFRFQQGNFKIVNKMFMSDSWDSVSKGGGKQVKGIYGYTHEGYISYSKSLGALNHEFLFGRTFLEHGFGNVSDLLISTDSRPFDAFRWRIKYKSIIGTLDAIQLEPVNGENRFMTLHSIRLNLSNGLSLLFSESSLYASSGGFNWQLLNPVIFWIPERENFPIISANGLLYGSIKYDISDKYSCFLEILIDDWQINKRSLSDLEPNEIGFTTGIQSNDFLVPNFNLWLEYTKVTNRTYQTPDIVESYIHRGFPIGHYLGNDFEIIQLKYSMDLTSTMFKPYLSMAYHNDGANGLDTPFDTPWMNDSSVSLETGYSEKFPTHPLSSTIEVELAADYDLKNGSLINAGILYSNKNSLANVPSGFSFVFRLWITFGKSIKY